MARVGHCVNSLQACDFLFPFYHCNGSNSLGSNNDRIVRNQWLDLTTVRAVYRPVFLLFPQIHCNESDCKSLREK